MAIKKKATEPTAIQRFHSVETGLKTSPKDRLQNFFFRFFHPAYLEFERLEIEAVHDEELPNMLQVIKGDIAKARIEKRKEVKMSFAPRDVGFNLEGNPERWPMLITRENYFGLFRDEDIPHYVMYLDGRNVQDVIDAYRKIGLLRKVVKELLKNKRLKLELEREHVGGGWGGYMCPVLKVSW